MSRPTQGRLPAGDIRPPKARPAPRAASARATTASLAASAMTWTAAARDTWPDFVRATAANPDGSWTCACSAAGHATRLGRYAASPSRACWPGPCPVAPVPRQAGRPRHPGCQAAPGTRRPARYSRTGPTGHAPYARRYYATRWLPCHGARRGSGRVASSDSFMPADRRAGWSAICARIESGYR
jgi:hypothetical protein